MKRYVAIKGLNREWLITDMKATTPRVIATTTGWYANPDLIIDALNSYDRELNKLLDSANVQILGE